MQELDMAKINNEKVSIEVVEMTRDTNPKTKTYARGKFRVDSERTLHHFSVIKGKKDYNPFFVMFPFKRFYENSDGYTNAAYDFDLLVPDNYDDEDTSSSTVWKAVDAVFLAAFYDAYFSEAEKVTMVEEYKQFRRGKFRSKDNYTPGCDNCLFRETHRPTEENERGLTSDRQSRHYCALWQRYVDRDVQKYFDNLEKAQRDKQPRKDKMEGIKPQKVDNLIKGMLNSEGRGCLQHTFKFEKGDGWVIRKPYAKPLMEVLQKFERVVNVGNNVVVDTNGIYEWVEREFSEDNGGSGEQKQENKKSEQNQSDDELPPFSAAVVEGREGLDEKSARSLGRSLGLGNGLEGEQLEKWVEEYVELGA